MTELKRPKEVVFEFPQPPQPYPQSQRSGAFIGPSGVGKTTTALSMLMGPYKMSTVVYTSFRPHVLKEWIRPGMLGENLFVFI